MTFPTPPRFLDERFFEHRRRSTSIAGMAGGAASGGLFLYRELVDHVRNWDLFAVLVIIVAVKLGMMLWYRFTR
jgi:hypothetical protein